MDQKRSNLMLLIVFEDASEVEGFEGVPLSVEELWAEFDPMQTQRVQESRQSLHQNQDGDGQNRPGRENEVKHHGPETILKVNKSLQSNSYMKLAQGGTDMTEEHKFEMKLKK